MGCGGKMAKSMKKEYGSKKGMKVYYATKNKMDTGFYGHMTVDSALAGHEITSIGRGDEGNCVTGITPIPIKHIAGTG